MVSDASNRGIQYEKLLYEKLKNEGKVPDNSYPAGENSKSPDLVLKHNGNNVNVEVKLSQACDFGQVEIRYNLNFSRWEFGGANEHIKSLYSDFKILEEINNTWKICPNKEIIKNQDFTWENAKEDYAHFKSFYIPVPSNFISQFYGNKNIHYLQIKKYGFYHLENDIFDIGTPKFLPEVHLRVRIKRRSSRLPYAYGFLVALKVYKKAEKSIINLENL